jgi:hypothetical protein
MNKKKPSILCRRGHRKTGRNLILRKRINKKTGKVQVVKECRKCANASLQARREAHRRNEILLKLETSWN